MGASNRLAAVMAAIAGLATPDANAEQMTAITQLGWLRIGDPTSKLRAMVGLKVWF